MKVGVFLEDFSPEVGGGYTIQEDIFLALCRLIDETEHSFVIFCRRPDDFQPYLSKRIQAVAFPGSFGDRALAKAQRSIDSFGDKRKVQTRLEQLARAAGVEFLWFVGAEALQTDIPYMAIVWDLQHRLQPWFPEVSTQGTWRHREAFYSEYLRRATIIIAGTDAGRLEIERFYQVTSDRIQILPHPTPAFALHAKPSDTDAVKRKFGLRNDYVFYPAQFWSHKNHVNLLLALSRLKEEYELDLTAVFAGSDKGNREYVKQFASQLQPSIQTSFLGFVPLEDLVALYRGALALTYVTLFGPENLPPLEAFALGCPVIASEVSGAREQLGDAALLVDAREPAAIADAVKRLYDDHELRRTLIDRGHVRAESWTAKEFVRGVFHALDEFARVRRCWGN
jgi:glycosyltransferase involved in cell wall biosynthesis